MSDAVVTGVRDYLEMCAAMYADHGMGWSGKGFEYDSMHAFILAEGRSFENKRKPSGVRYGAMKMCFANTLKFVLAQRPGEDDRGDGAMDDTVETRKAAQEAAERVLDEARRDAAEVGVRACGNGFPVLSSSGGLLLTIHYLDLDQLLGVYERLNAVSSDADRG